MEPEKCLKWVEGMFEVEIPKGRLSGGVRMYQGEEISVISNTERHLCPQT